MLEQAGYAAAAVMEGREALGPRLLAAYNAQVMLYHKQNAQPAGPQRALRRCRSGAVMPLWPGAAAGLEWQTLHQFCMPRFLCINPTGLPKFVHDHPESAIRSQRSQSIVCMCMLWRCTCQWANDRCWSTFLRTKTWNVQRRVTGGGGARAV